MIKDKKDDSPIYRLLVIQTESLERQFQSLMALSAARRLYPQLEIYFLTDRDIAEPVRSVSWIKQVYEIDSKKLIKPIILGHLKPNQVIGELSKELKPVINTAWDFIFNWSYSKSSSYLAALIPALVKSGYTRSSDDKILMNDDWSQYFFSVIQNNYSQNIHAIDILTTQLLTTLQIYIGESKKCENESVTSKMFFDKIELDCPIVLWERTRHWVGVQYDHFSEKFEFKNFIETLLLRNPDCSIILFGNDKYKSEVEKMLNESLFDSSRVISEVGPLRFSRWASIIGECSAIITSDPKTSQLASLLGTRVYYFASRGDDIFRSAPYGNGHVLVKGIKENKNSPEMLAQDVYEIWSYYSKRGFFKNESCLEVLQSKIRPLDEGGGVVYKEITEGVLDFENWFSLVLGYVVRKWYCGWVPALGQELHRNQVDLKLIQEVRKLKEATSAFIKITENSIKILEKLKEKSSKLPSESIMLLEDRYEIVSLNEQLQESYLLIERLGGVQKPFNVLSDLLKGMMHNLKSDQISEMSHEALRNFQKLKEAGEMIEDWVEYTLWLGKPQIISSSVSIP